MDSREIEIHAKVLTKTAGKSADRAQIRTEVVQAFFVLKTWLIFYREYPIGVKRELKVMADSKSYAKMVEELKGQARQEPKITFGTPAVKNSVDELANAKANLQALMQKHQLQIQELCAKIDQKKSTPKRASQNRAPVATQPTPSTQTSQPTRMIATDTHAQKKYIALLEEEVAKLKTDNLKLQVDRETYAAIQSEVEQLRRLTSALKDELIESKSQNIALREKLLRIQKTDF